MYYPDHLIEEVRTKNDIVDVISGYVRIAKKGSSHFGLCPFHNEKSPSFSVSGNRQMYYCFGCGAGGNVFTFIMEYENFSFPEAVKLLAEKAGVTLPEVEYSEEVRKKENKRAKLLEINKEAAKYFYYQLRSERGRNAHEYLQKRSLTTETIQTFGLGYANKNSDDLVRYLKNKGYDEALIIEAGLASFHEKYGTSDKFWNRVMFPIQDLNHRVIGFGGRVMGESEETKSIPKYLNSPETLVFDKSRNLYGLNFARTSRKNHVILCEGYLDVIALHQAGFTQAVASLGTAFTAGQANLLRRYAEEVILAYDSDEAGRKAILRAITILKECGLTGRVLDLSPYKDPDDFVNNLGALEFEKRISEAQNSFFYELSVMENGFNLNDPEQKTRFHREIAKKLCTFSEDVERDNYLEAVCEKYHIGFENLRKLVLSYAAQTGLAVPITRPKSGTADKFAPESHAMKAERLLLTWLSEEPALYAQINKYLTAADFSAGLYQKAAAKLFADFEKNEVNPAAIISLFIDEEEQREVASIFNTRLGTLESKAEREKAINDIVRTVKKNSHDKITKSLGNDVNAISQALEGRRALDELLKTNIKLP
ncbi:MAG: DNA primase [Lachnospiraceae bacterium]|nr:DNA primase [Lachnospiraceae bacterium]